MPQFISKLQHNTYEKGEFSEKQPRNLKDTLQLINNFPWDAERPLTDIQLTGPSVTIENEAGEYLKVGLYFNGKFCLYFLDKSNHVYEYHVSDILMVSNVVTGYFNGTMLLDNFEKHFFNIGSKTHFKTADFTYTVNTSWFYLSLSTLLISGTLTAGMAIIELRHNLIVSGMSFLLTLFIGLSVYIVLQYYVKSKDMILRVSQGSNRFEFGTNTIEIFYKKDIDKIKIFQNNSTKSSGRYDIIDIYFKDNSFITFPGLLLNNWQILNKFPNIHIEHIINPLTVIRRIWKFSK